MNLKLAQCSLGDFIRDPVWVLLVSGNELIPRLNIKIGAWTHILGKTRWWVMSGDCVSAWHSFINRKSIRPPPSSTIISPWRLPPPPPQPLELGSGIMASSDHISSCFGPTELFCFSFTLHAFVHVFIGGFNCSAQIHMTWLALPICLPLVCIIHTCMHIWLLV